MGEGRSVFIATSFQPESTVRQYFLCCAAMLPGYGSGGKQPGFHLHLGCCSEESTRPREKL
jgi:hypothetical protein